MLKLKLQSFGHLMRSIDSLEKTLMLGGLRAHSKLVAQPGRDFEQSACLSGEPFLCTVLPMEG